MTTGQPEIRRAMPGDWRVVKRVRLAALQEAPYAFGSTYEREKDRAAAEWRSWIGREGEREGKAIFVAHDGADAVGMVGAFHETKTSVMLVAMWVAPDARSSGLGRRLTQAILDWAADVRARRVTLWVADDNPEAIAHYRAMSFEPTAKKRPLPSEPNRQISEYARSPR